MEKLGGDSFLTGGEDPDAAAPSKGRSKGIRGGSYLCRHSYRDRYRVAARSRNTPDSSTGHMGFPVASDAR